MDSIPRKRPKSETKIPNRNPKSSSSSPIRSLLEPSESLFPSKEEFARLLTVLLVACAVAFACSFLSKHLSSNPKSFCDSNFDSIDSDLDLCEPCPINGECYQGKLQCNHGFRRNGNLCVEDGEINESTKKLVMHFEKKVCEAYAHNECYGGTGTVWVLENDIWKDLRSIGFMNNLDEPAYNFVKGKAVEAIAELLEKRTNSNGINELKCPESLMESYKPVTCRMYQWLLQHIFIVSSSCATLVGCAILLRKIQRKRYFSRRVEELYDQVCDFLEENAVASNSPGGTNCDPWVIASRLRDHLLLPRERRDPLLWSKVEELIKEDSRIDRYNKVVKGEQKVVWEWQVEGSVSLSKLKKRRESQKKVRQIIDSSTLLQENYNRRIAETSS